MSVVTGANTGIGYETALGLVQQEMTVVLACRDLSKAEAAKAKILKAMPSASVDIIQLNLSQLSSVKAFAEQYRKTHSRLAEKLWSVSKELTGAAHFREPVA